MKQDYRKPFKRNSEKVKELHHDYMQVSLVHFSTEIDHCRQCFETLELDAAAVPHVFKSIAEVGFNLYNTAHLLTFLDTLHIILIPAEEIDGSGEVSTKLPCSAAGSLTTYVFLFFICHHILHFSTLLRRLFSSLALESI